MSAPELSTRARAIVRRAADQTSVSMVSSWLRYDEHGAWESRVREILTDPKVLSRAAELGMDDDAVDAEVCILIRLLALEAARRCA